MAFRLSAILILLFCSLSVYGQDHPQAQNGVLDLRQYDLNEAAFPLEGEFRFYWKQFIEPSRVDQAYHSTLFPDFPMTWNRQVVGKDTLNAKGYATYQVTILLPSLVPNKELALAIQDMYSAYKLYLNEELMASNGVVGTSKENYTPYWLPQTVTFVPKSDTLTLTLQVANFDHSKGGVKEDIVFGDASRVVTEFENDLAFDYILTGCLLMGGLFFFGLYFFGRHEFSMLFFSLFCLAYSYRITGAANYSFHHLFPGIPWSLTLHLEYISLYLSGYLFVKYTYHLYPQESAKRVMDIYAWLSLLMILITLVAPIDFFTLFPAAYFVGIFTFIPYSIWIYIKAVKNRRYGATFALVSLGALFLSFIFDMLDYFEVLRRQNVILFFSYTMFFFFQSLILSYRFAMSYRRAIKDAQKASEAKSEFLSVMSHEIRTPLNAVVGMSNLLDVKGEQKEEVNTLKHAAQNLLLLVNDILDYTKIEAGKVEFEEVDTDLRDMVEKLRLIHSAKAIEDSLDLTVEVDEELPKYIVCDPTRITQVLSNLVSNGLKFTHQGYVKVKLSQIQRTEDEVSIRFEVLDTGIGIPAEKQSLIYETFTQATTSITRNYGGTGLGLSITKKLLNLQGSELELESRVGEGSRFFFEQTFKVVKGMARTSIPRPSLDEWDLLAGKRLLLVEDNPVNIVVAKKFLERWKTEVDVAMNGEEALAKTIDHDLILMDLQLPDIDGYEISKRLRQAGVTIPILAFTASALMNVREKISASGMNDYVIKPFDPAELYRKIVRQIG